MAGNGLFIGEVAARSGLSRKALRLYEARGILKAPRRTPSGYRHYDSDVLRLLRFVSQARRLGLTLTEIRQIVALRRSGSAPCVSPECEASSTPGAQLMGAWPPYARTSKRR